jgi:hypothetical protein
LFITEPLIEYELNEFDELFVHIINEQLSNSISLNASASTRTKIRLLSHKDFERIIDDLEQQLFHKVSGTIISGLTCQVRITHFMLISAEENAAQALSIGVERPETDRQAQKVPNLPASSHRARIRAMFRVPTLGSSAMLL